MPDKYSSFGPYEEGLSRRAAHGKPGRPPLRDWREHRWWSTVTGAAASGWSREVCWIWTRECKGECPMITIRRRRVSVRRHLYEVVLSEEKAGVNALDPDTIILAGDNCSSSLCINPWHAKGVSRVDFAREAASAAWEEMNPGRTAGKRGRQGNANWPSLNEERAAEKMEQNYRRYSSFAWAWHDTGIVGRIPHMSEDAQEACRERFEKENPGIRAEALKRSAKLNRS
jgi:hypothetical protein